MHHSLFFFCYFLLCHQYFQNELTERIVDPIRKCMKELRHGFQTIVSTSWLSTIGVGPLDLQLLICGNLVQDEHFNIRELFRIRQDDDVKDCPALFHALFSVVDDLSAVNKRMFLKFVTGIDKLPLPGSETIKIDSPFMCFSDEEHAINLMRLPTAHTCFNTIEIPNYVASMLELQHDGSMLEELEEDTKELFLNQLRLHLKEKLILAVLNTDGGGYGLDEGVQNREEEWRSSAANTSSHTSGGGTSIGTTTNAGRPSVTIIREESHEVEVEQRQPVQQQQQQQESPPREETPREGEESEGSYDIPGLSDDDSDLDDLFAGF